MRASVKELLVGTGVAAGILAIGYGVIMILMAARFKEQKTVRAMPIQDIDLAKIRDGSFPGDFSYGDFTYQVTVTVKNHRIEDVKILKNRTTEHAQRAEGVVEEILKSQSLNVDAVSGATTTSKALLKTVENALTKGIE